MRATKSHIIVMPLSTMKHDSRPLWSRISRLEGAVEQTYNLFRIPNPESPPPINQLLNIKYNILLKSRKRMLFFIFDKLDSLYYLTLSSINGCLLYIFFGLVLVVVNSKKSLMRQYFIFH